MYTTEVYRGLQGRHYRSFQALVNFVDLFCFHNLASFRLVETNHPTSIKTSRRISRIVLQHLNLIQMYHHLKTTCIIYIKKQKKNTLNVPLTFPNLNFHHIKLHDRVRGRLKLRFKKIYVPIPLFPQLDCH